MSSPEKETRYESAVVALQKELADALSEEIAAFQEEARTSDERDHLHHLLLLRKKLQRGLYSRKELDEILSSYNDVLEDTTHLDPQQSSEVMIEQLNRQPTVIELAHLVSYEQYKPREDITDSFVSRLAGRAVGVMDNKQHLPSATLELSEIRPNAEKVISDIRIEADKAEELKAAIPLLEEALYERVFGEWRMLEQRTLEEQDLEQISSHLHTGLTEMLKSFSQLDNHGNVIQTPQSLFIKALLEKVESKQLVPKGDIVTFRERLDRLAGGPNPENADRARHYITTVIDPLNYYNRLLADNNSA